MVRTLELTSVLNVAVLANHVTYVMSLNNKIDLDEMIGLGIPHANTWLQQEVEVIWDY